MKKHSQFFTFLVFLVALFSANMVQAQNAVTNGAFTGSATGWSLNGGWNWGGDNIQNSADDPAVTGNATQSLSGVKATGNHLTFTTSFYYGAGGGTPGGQTRLTISYAGVVYATLVSPATGAYGNATFTASNGASVSPGIMAMNSSVAVDITLPTVPTSGVLSFAFNPFGVIARYPGNDMGLDNVFLTSCVVPTAVTIAGTTTYCQNVAATALTSSFTGEATGATYQWYAGGVAISGATANTYTPPTTTAGVVNYTVKVTNGCGNSTSANYAVTINTAPTITTPPAAVTICPNGNASFTVTPAGSGPYTYQWQVSADNGATYYNECASCASGTMTVAGGTSATITYTGVTAAYGSRLFRAVVTNTCGTITSAPAQLTLNAAPTITTQPSGQTVCVGSSATFTAVASATGNTYQWEQSADGITWGNEADGAWPNGAVSGATTESLTKQTNATTVNKFYRLKTTNSCGTVTSNAVNLTIATPITPTLSAAAATNACPATTANIMALVNSSLPGGATLEFYTSNTPIPGNLVATPTTVGAGTYYAFYKSAGGCYSAASAGIVVSITAPCGPLGDGSDLRPLYVMADVGFVKPSALTKSATLHIYNVGTAVSVAAGLITVHIYPPNSQFTIALGIAPGWSMTYDAGDNYYTLTSTSTTVAFGAANFQAVPLVITAASAIPKGKYTFSFEIADGSGGETNNLNNTVPIEVTVSAPSL